MIYLACLLGIILFDFSTKYLARTRLCQMDTIPLWKDVFHLTYVENRGAAFGFFQGKTLFLVIITFTVLTTAFFVVHKLKPKSKLLKLGICFVAAGAIGNLIDRISLGYVVDFFDFRLINFPVFNVADIFVCIGTALIAVFVIFVEDRQKKAAEERAKYED